MHVFDLAGYERVCLQVIVRRTGSCSRPRLLRGFRERCTSQHPPSFVRDSGAAPVWPEDDQLSQGVLDNNIAIGFAIRHHKCPAPSARYMFTCQTRTQSSLRTRGRARDSKRPRLEVECKYEFNLPFKLLTEASLPQLCVGGVEQTILWGSNGMGCCFIYTECMLVSFRLRTSGVRRPRI
ncbi:uncharacterized protein EI90DRAFT_3034061, partial [Cantharellus anzutake]|uniref:uncharacterized protein n=1 Tax=Cantharellus anzutake TaxID=1750568 RepID=UPI001904002C